MMMYVVCRCFGAANTRVNRASVLNFLTYFSFYFLIFVSPLLRASAVSLSVQKTNIILVSEYQYPRLSTHSHVNAPHSPLHLFPPGIHYASSDALSICRSFLRRTEFVTPVPVLAYSCVV